jgi:hypothetical protein
MSKVDLINSPIVQSPYTYLQAAGSDGSDRTIKGNQLRWDFLKALGENHIAKGNYTLSSPYVSSIGYNRSNDFIKIYRTLFRKKYFLKIDFQVSGTTVINSGTTRAWKYSLPVDSLSGVNADVVVRFIDYTQYDSLRAAQSTFNTLALLNAYTGIVEVEVENKLFFYAELDLRFKGTVLRGGGIGSMVSTGLSDMSASAMAHAGAGPGGQLRVESVTIPDTSEFATKQVSCRKRFTGLTERIISCENIQYLRFDYKGADWKEIRIYCYEHYISGTNIQVEAGDWDDVGSFALTTDDTTMSARFMPSDVDGSGGHWPKFNDDNPGTGEFTVNKQNYANRWRRPGFTFSASPDTSNDQNSLQHFIHTYMKLSTTDERALASIKSDDSPTDPTTQDISYVDMIRLMSLDYHVARVLGMGHIDPDRNLDKSAYIYCLEYKTFAALEAPYTSNAERTHIFMTTPVTRRDYRLPATPILTPLTYGISVDNGTGTPTLLTDPNGYAPFGNLRFININRGPFNFEKPFGPFYYESTEFCLCDETQPVAFGLEYKEISETGYRKPELSSDSEYLDASGLPETTPILLGDKPQIYTHQEVEEGTHEYRSYSINWFSRVSPLSNPVQAVTTFPKQSHLLPPFNFAVQLVQDEDPTEPIALNKTLILTTVAEQNILSVIPAANDKTLVRTTFDWNHVHHHAHQYADYADIFFRRFEPIIVKGQVSSVSLLSGNRSQITTTSYTITSTFPATTVTPTIASSDSTKFIGSFFSTAGDNYVIESVITSGSNPTFVIKQLKQINAVADPSAPGQFISNETFKNPTVGDLFFTTENMGAVSNWDLRHSKRTYLEKFYTNAKVELRLSPTRTNTYDIKGVNLASGVNTEIQVEKLITTIFSPGLTLEYSVKHEIIAIGLGTFSISGDATADFVSSKPFRVFANKANDSLYTVNSSSFTGGNTVITVNEVIPDITNIDGLIEIEVSRNVTNINNVTNTFRISGNKIAEINAAHIEYKTESDGTLSRFVVGGINDTVNFEPLLTDPPLPADIEGTGFIQLKFQNYDLLPHPDSEVSWYKGMVRLTDVGGSVQVYPVTYIGNVTSGPAPHLAIVIQDPGFVPKSEPGNITGADIYTLNLGAAQNANYHPGYKLYLTADNGVNTSTGSPLPSSAINFDSDEILPVLSDPSEGSRQTYMSIRSYDIKNDLESFLSNPVVLLAQKISIPVPPGPPSGPLYATRPDFYGKSTYTFDTKMNTTGGRIPYSVVFYRASEDRLLDILYTKDTQNLIWSNLNKLIDPKAKYDPLLWQVLFDGQNTGGNFSVYTTTSGSFTWPLPDNPEFYIPYTSNKALGTSNPPPSGYYVFPFENAFGFALDQTFTVYGQPMTGKAILKSAIQDAFMPLNEQPPIFNYFKTGKQTSGIKPQQRDAFGNLLDPFTNDIFPMIRKYNSGTDTFVRFTDYTLDGASKSLYFYRALEMDDKFKFSDSSLPVGPVMLVNTFYPNKPQVRKIITKLLDVENNIKTSVLFEINEYPENEKISRIEIYRAISAEDALSIRTMKKVKSVIWGDDLIDNFTDVGVPLYGEDLHYRLVAIRDVEDVEDVILAPQVGSDPIPTVITKLPSLPSDIAKAVIVDRINPESPIISYTSDAPTIVLPITLDNVILSWPSTCYNGTYSLYKMNSLGVWEKIYEVKSNNPVISIPLLSTVLANGTLVKSNLDGNTLYHRFRVQVVNTSGLINLKPSETTI